MTILPREQFERAAAGVAGLHTSRHAQMLHGLVRWLQPRSVVEVGAFAGGTSVWLARALQENGAGELVLIDDFSLDPGGYAALWHNIGACGVADVTAVHVGRSEDPGLWPERVDMAYIDGDHSARGCTDDVERAIARGASCVVVHDVASWWGPRCWLECFRSREGRWDVLQVSFDEGLAVALRRDPLPPVTFSQALYPTGAI